MMSSNSRSAVRWQRAAAQEEEEEVRMGMVGGGDVERLAPAPRARRRRSTRGITTISLSPLGQTITNMPRHGAEEPSVERTRAHQRIWSKTASGAQPGSIRAACVRAGGEGASTSRPTLLASRAAAGTTRHRVFRSEAARGTDGRGAPAAQATPASTPDGWNFARPNHPSASSNTVSSTRSQMRGVIDLPTEA